MLFLLVLVSALLHAVWNAAVKKPADVILAMGQLCFFAAIISFVSLFFFPFPYQAAWGYLLSSAAVHWVYKFCLIKLYHIGDFGIVYPIFRGLAPVLFIVISIPISGTGFFNELSLIDFFAIILILCSVIFIDSNVLSGLRQKKSLKSLKIAIMVSCCIALYSNLDAKAARLTSPHGYVSWLFFLDNLGFFIFCFWKRKNLFSRLNFYQGAGASFCYIFSYWVVIYAWSVSNAIVIASLREVSVVFAVILATFFLKEKFTIRKIFFAVMIFVGVFLLKNNF